ncbi:MAG: hypothetical protein KDE51_27430, partial [Anaerolineales bacterium]|nr:hypothetical protein [Anaerolineales bacterium]
LVKLRDNGKPWEWPNGGGILAHEIGHNYDREHIKCGDFPESQQDFNFLPFDNCRLSYEDDDALFTHYGFDPIAFGQAKSAVITPDAAADIMSYNGDKWITAFFWDAVLKEVIKIPIPSTLEDMVNVEEFLLVQGAIASDQTTAAFTRLAIVAADVAPEQQVTRSLAQQAALAGREPVSYTLTLADAAGQPLDTFTVAAEPSHEASADSPISFIQYVPWNAQAVRVQLHLAETLLADYPLSQHPPAVSIQSLQVDDQAETVLLTWEMSDEDSDPLVATVQYSADGDVWQPLILETAATEVTLPTELLAGSDSGRLRVIVNDGAYMAVAISEPFAVPNQPPIVQFDGVQEGARLAYNQSLIFYGMAFDVEDGHIDSDALLWFLSGPITRLGVGSDFSVDKLPQGEYSLMASVLDSNDVRGEQVVRFEVLPPEVPDTNTPNMDGYCGDDDYLDALVIAADDGEKTVPVYLLHAHNALYICFNRMTLSDNLFAIQYAGIKLDLNASGLEGLQTGDRGFFINSHGELFQTKRTFPSLVVTEEPDFGYSGSIKRGSDSWSAEIRIADELLEGWDHAVRMALHLNTNSATSTANPWPETAVDENADHWAPAYFGSAPAAENRPPTADAGDMIIHQFAAAQTVYLDGQGSYDSDGDTLTYSWSQTGGSAVALQGATTALPYFEVQPVTEMQELSFTLTVSDGALESDSAQVRVILLPPAPQPSSANRQLYLPFVIR